MRGAKVFAWLASVGHWLDVGGNVPGNFNAKATESFQEGFRVPPVKLIRAGVLATRLPQERNTRRTSASQAAVSATCSITSPAHTASKPAGKSGVALTLHEKGDHLDKEFERY